ncbi:MAG: quinone-dependent dihydroorotate dehydrogenase [Acidiferrobacterales bacterium]
MYRVFRPLLFSLDPEYSHDLTLGLLRCAYRVPGMGAFNRSFHTRRTPSLPVDVMGLQLRNPVGLAAGLDKNAGCIAPLADLGFGFLELGTVTPRAQSGNPKKRMYRIETYEALINRMGFNNVGLESFLVNLSRAPRVCPLGINIGKNRDTPAERALDDYLLGLRSVYPVADYVAVNVSSPNTPGLRALQEQETLAILLAALKSEQETLARTYGRYVPIALKIAPDLADADIGAIARLLLAHRIDAVIATNTTITRPGLEKAVTAQQSGGLSGKPLRALATHVIRELYRELAGHIPIIGVGGISDADSAWEKILAGADLLQIYTALIYRGPAAVRQIVSGIASRMRTLGATNFTEARTMHAELTRKRAT